MLILFNKKIIFEIHDSLNVEGRVVRFIQRKFKLLNSKNIIKIITTTNSLKINYSKYWSVDSKKITVLHNASSLKTKFVKSFNNLCELDGENPFRITMQRIIEDKNRFNISYNDHPLCGLLQNQ